MKRLLCCAILGLAVLGCGSAGPYAYVYMTTLQATRAVATAKSANAEKMAPYEYWAAVTYLQMSREKATSADYEMAYNYGKKARDMADKAKKIAVGKGEEGPDAEAATQAPTQVVTEPAPAGGEGSGGDSGKGAAPAVAPEPAAKPEKGKEEPPKDKGGAAEGVNP